MDFTVRATDEEGNVISTSEKTTEESTESTETTETSTEESTEATEEATAEGSTEETGSNESEDLNGQEASTEADTATIQDNVWSTLTERYGANISNVEELDAYLASVEKTTTLSENVQKYLEYENETGRSMEDFIALNRDFESIPEKDLLVMHEMKKNPRLSQEDAEFLVNKNHYPTFDEYEDNSDAKRMNDITRGSAYKEALDAFNADKAKYGTVAESADNKISAEIESELNELRQYKASLDQQNTDSQEKNRVFSEKTDALFDNPEFKGFEFEVSGEKMTYELEDPSKTKEVQSSFQNFIDQFVDKNGYLKDAAAFHRAISMASNPKAYANFFYEKGLAKGIQSSDAEGKNTNYKRAVDNSGGDAGLKIRVLNDGPKSEFKVRSRKK